MKLKLKGPRRELRIIQIIKNAINATWGCFKRLFLLNRVLSKREKVFFYAAFSVLILVLGIKSVYFYRSITKEAPAVGGTYSEGLIGQPEFINPVLASNENDKTVCSLVYEGLIKLDDKNQASPRLAATWEISPDQKNYLFHLRDGVVFQDGKPFDSSDVAYTFGLIQDPGRKSPLYNNFKDVLIETPDRLSVKFSLKTPYGPFLTNLNVGIIPQGKQLTELNKQPMGTGPYQFHSSSIHGQTVNNFVLERFEGYYGVKPNIKKVEFHFYDSEFKAKTLYDQEEFSALGLNYDRTKSVRLKYPTSAKIVLMFNLRQAPFNDKTLRKNIAARLKAPAEVKFDLIVSDEKELVATADNFKDSMAQLGYKVNVISLKETDFKERMAKRDFQSLVVGIDFGHDFDPYPLWHSSQAQDGLNLSGFSSKLADILLEDARQITDSAARQAKYEEFNKILADESPEIILQDKEYVLDVDDNIKNVTVAGALTPSEHLRNIVDWYISTKRVKK